jgi:hypothetical protein
MNTHPYLRAYMAGIVPPTFGLLIALTIFIATRLVFHVPVPLERVIIFPMALVPNAFGLWNMLYLWYRPRRYLPIGLHGALLPPIFVALGFLVVTAGRVLVMGDHGVVWFQAVTVPYGQIAVLFLVGIGAYYLIWKYFVGFLNRVLGIA